MKPDTVRLAARLNEGDNVTSKPSANGSSACPVQDHRGKRARPTPHVDRTPTYAEDPADLRSREELATIGARFTRRVSLGLSRHPNLQDGSETDSAVAAELDGCWRAPWRELRPRSDDGVRRWPSGGSWRGNAARVSP
jgi:hypothetical protein